MGNTPEIEQVILKELEPFKALSATGMLEYEVDEKNGRINFTIAKTIDDEVMNLANCIPLKRARQLVSNNKEKMEYDTCISISTFSQLNTLSFTLFTFANALGTYCASQIRENVLQGVEFATIYVRLAGYNNVWSIQITSDEARCARTYRTHESPLRTSMPGQAPVLAEEGVLSYSGHTDEVSEIHHDITEHKKRVYLNIVPHEDPILLSEKEGDQKVQNTYSITFKTLDDFNQYFFEFQLDPEEKQEQAQPLEQEEPFPLEEREVYKERLTALFKLADGVIIKTEQGCYSEEKNEGVCSMISQMLLSEIRQVRKELKKERATRTASKSYVKPLSFSGFEFN